MAPEQKEMRVADVRNDIYSLGVILEEMHLGWQYRAVIKRCFRPAAKRPQNVSALQRSLHHMNVAYMACAFVLVLTLLAPILVNGYAAYKQNTIEVEQLRDSLHQSTERERQLMNKELQRAAHEQAKQKFIAEQEAYLVQECKKLTNPKHPIWHGGDITVYYLKVFNEIPKHVATRTDFNKEEVAAIKFHLDNFWYAQYLPIYQKYIRGNYHLRNSTP